MKCLLCNEDLCLNDGVFTKCGHSLHVKCFRTWRGSSSKCPECKINLFNDENAKPCLKTIEKNRDNLLSNTETTNTEFKKEAESSLVHVEKQKLNEERRVSDQAIVDLNVQKRIAELERKNAELCKENETLSTQKRQLIEYFNRKVDLLNKKANDNRTDHLQKKCTELKKKLELEIQLKYALEKNVRKTQLELQEKRQTLEISGAKLKMKESIPENKGINKEDKNVAGVVQKELKANVSPREIVLNLIQLMNENLRHTQLQLQKEKQPSTKILMAETKPEQTTASRDVTENKNINQKIGLNKVDEKKEEVNKVPIRKGIIPKGRVAKTQQKQTTASRDVAENKNTNQKIGPNIVDEKKKVNEVSIRSGTVLKGRVAETTPEQTIASHDVAENKKTIQKIGPNIVDEKKKVNEVPIHNGIVLKGLKGNVSARETIFKISQQMKLALGNDDIKDVMVNHYNKNVSVIVSLQTKALQELFLSNKNKLKNNPEMQHIQVCAYNATIDLFTYAMRLRNKGYSVHHENNLVFARIDDVTEPIQILNKEEVDKIMNSTTKSDVKTASTLTCSVQPKNSVSKCKRQTPTFSKGSKITRTSERQITAPCDNSNTPHAYNQWKPLFLNPNATCFPAPCNNPHTSESKSVIKNISESNNHDYQALKTNGASTTNPTFLKTEFNLPVACDSPSTFRANSQWQNPFRTNGTYTPKPMVPTATQGTQIFKRHPSLVPQRNRENVKVVKPYAPCDDDFYAL